MGQRQNEEMRSLTETSLQQNEEVKRILPELWPGLPQLKDAGNKDWR